MSLLLVLEHLGGLSLPGCGRGGPCEQAAASIWGKVQIGRLKWPVSYLGLAYFLAALAMWLATRGAVPKAFRYLVRLGVLGSLGFCIIILVEWLFCSYCLAAHAGNFAFWITMERTRAPRRRGAVAMASFAAAFVLSSAALAIVDWQRQIMVARKAEQERLESVQRIVEQSRPLEPGPSQPATTTPASTPPVAAPQAATSPADLPVGGGPFTGRYRRGPEVAAIRIVIFTDFQCRDCRQIEQQAAELLAERGDVSLSIKHFPFCTDCNPHAPRNLHPNACWAARAAEAAGMLWGDDGFWKMHDWLFQRQGAFTTSEEVRVAIRGFGYDPFGFFEAMQSEETLRLVQQDAQEAADLGLFFTPMIFINGVELKGWHAPEALKRTVAEVARTHPPPRTAAYDRPPLALAKCVADWKEEPERRLPADPHAWVLGPESAAIRIVMWGDYQEPGTVEADRIIRGFVAGRNDAQYTFRHYPFNRDCNANLPFDRHPLACWAARSAEAAGLLGGDEGYWRMHAWLMENSNAALEAAAQSIGADPADLRNALYAMTEDARRASAARMGFDVSQVLETMRQAGDQALRSAAPELGFEADTLLAAMERDEVQAHIAEDVQAARQLPSLLYGTPPGLHGVPTIFINERYVPRWRLGDQVVLDAILQAATDQ